MNQNETSGKYSNRFCNDTAVLPILFSVTEYCITILNKIRFKISFSKMYAKVKFRKPKFQLIIPDGHLNVL